MQPSFGCMGGGLQCDSAQCLGHGPIRSDIQSDPTTYDWAGHPRVSGLLRILALVTRLPYSLALMKQASQKQRCASSLHYCCTNCSTVIARLY